MMMIIIFRSGDKKDINSFIRYYVASLDV